MLFSSILSWCLLCSSFGALLGPSARFIGMAQEHWAGLPTWYNSSGELQYPLNMAIRDLLGSTAVSWILASPQETQSGNTLILMFRYITVLLASWAWTAINPFERTLCSHVSGRFGFGGSV